MMSGNEALFFSKPDVSLQDWLTVTIGPYRFIGRFAHDHGCSELWRLQAEDSRFFWLKCHQAPGKWAGEVYALTHWVPDLELPSPIVVGHRASSPALLMTEIDGKIAENQELSPNAEETLWYDAGVYLARLHTIENDWFGAAKIDGTPQGEPHRDPVVFVRQSIETRLVHGRETGLYDMGEQDFIASASLDWTTALEGEIPRAIHRDYSPRNWMADPDGRLMGVIDFEHARWDVRASDMSRGWDKEFLHKPHLVPIFFQGYSGGMPEARFAAQIRALRLLQAVAGIDFAVRVGDEPFARLNREALNRLRSEACNANLIG